MEKYFTPVQLRWSASAVYSVLNVIMCSYFVINIFITFKWMVEFKKVTLFQFTITLHKLPKIAVNEQWQHTGDWLYINKLNKMMRQLTWIVDSARVTSASALSKTMNLVSVSTPTIRFSDKWN